MPLAPPLFSITMDCPISLPSGSEINLAEVSTKPPGGTGTTNASGQVTIKSAGYKTAGTVGFCVTGVTGPNDSFDATNACR